MENVMRKLKGCKIKKRYAGRKTACVCFHCRLSFKGNDECPTCGRELVYAGRAFKAPKRKNKKQWRLVEKYLTSGKMFHNRCDFGCCTGAQKHKKRNKLAGYALNEERWLSPWRSK